MWLPSLKQPRRSNEDGPTARQRLRAEATRGPRRRARGAPARPTSSSSVTVFLQLCSRVVKLDVVGEL